MADERSRTRRAVAVPLIAIALLLAYVLSVGPAFTILGASDCNPTVLRIHHCMYWPLDLLPEPFEGVLLRWIELWDIYGVNPMPKPR
jgi:hypothetical protein